MAGNVQSDNSGNIYVEFDYNNIIVVDPNKTIDAFGKIKERLVDHENLVMYANLEAEVLPRTKLAVGASPEDRVRIVSIAKMNFLKPTKDAFLGTGYYDELTGENTTKFKGDNQMLNQTVVPKDGSKPYVVDKPANVKNVFDNGLLGITNITIDTNLSFIPTVRIQLEDVQGRALFQLGNNSPYAAFFNLPYPPFYLTLKGFYGQAVRYQLNLEKFNARFNTFSGNYQIDLDFKGYKFNILNEIAVGHLIATPHMYSQQFNVTTNPVGPQTGTKSQETNAATQGKLKNVNDGRQTENTLQVTSERGYQKIKEVYSEYKSKGLIPLDFPEYSLPSFITKLDLFEQTVTEQFDKVEVESLTNIRNYKSVLKNYFDGVRGGQLSWFNRYLNPQAIILKDGRRIYVFKELDLKVRKEAQSQLESLVIDYNKQLADNPTLGVRGTSPITNPIVIKTIEIDAPPVTDVDWVTTTKSITGILKPNQVDVDNITKEFSKYFTDITVEVVTSDGKIVPQQQRNVLFVFEGTQRFDNQISLLETQANKKLSEAEDLLTKKLLEKLEKGTTGIGFKPTVRNIIAVLMASAEAFIRLLDDVHTNAWNLKYNEARKNAILNNPSSALGSDTRDNLRITKEAIEESTGLKYAEIPVYPWPQFFVETPEDKKGKFQLKYVGDPSVVELTQGWDYSVWPEVQFVEEYMRGLTMKFNPPLQPEPLDNQNDTNLININALEFPTTGVAYANKEEIKFFYEIYERQLVTSRYSNYFRATPSQTDELLKLNTETEVNNIIKSLGLNSPYITLKLKNYGLNSGNYLSFLENISNQGTGRAWQDFIRDFYVTPYLKNLTDNSFGILNVDEYGKLPQSTAKSVALENLVKNSTNEPNVTDTLPFTDTTWVQKNMADGVKSQGNDVYNTNKTLTIFEARKIISNFSNIYNKNERRPVTNFSYTKTDSPYKNALDKNSNKSLGDFYKTRKPTDFMVTEGYYFNLPPTFNLGAPVVSQFPSLTTTSMLNTPYMINAIQNGVENHRNKTNYPYVQAAYLFLNSLPLASLKEKYKSNNNGVQTDLDYIASCFKKFGAIHKLPYAWILKFGSIWHRYKVYKQSSVDILQSAWKNFDYTTNYSPIQNSVGQTYTVNYGTEKRDITLQIENTEQVNIQTGFYPKLINDFYQFCDGFDVYKDYTNAEIQNTINGGMKLYNFVGSNIETSQQGKPLRLKTWSVLIPGTLTTSDPNCNTSSPTKSTIYYIVPSFGSSINQTNYECVVNQTSTSNTIVNLSSNNAMYNGSVRCLWPAPNYGYFDNRTAVIPPPDAYPNIIQSGRSEQSPFYITAYDGYSKIEEVFSVFEKRILDTFESEFLNFCKPITDANIVTPTGIGVSSVSMSANFRNFQGLFRSLLAVTPKTSTQTEIEYFNEVVDLQYSNVQNTLRAFLEYDVLFRYGNPSNYKRRILDSYLSHNGTPFVTDPIVFQPYVQGSLPSRGGTTTLAQSRASNPEAWNTLELEVGFSTIPNVTYTSQGSYITDFFIDNNIQFTSQNIIFLSQVIKMYATFKLKNPTFGASQFKNQIETLINQENFVKNNFLNRVLEGLNKSLPNQSQVPQGTINSVITGQQSKVENWEVFKALNDKWIAGGDYKSKTLFEDILFLDRASRNIGETVLIDIFDLRSMLGKDSLNNAMSVFTLISGILIKNNFTVMNLPAYVNFYNVQDVDGTTIPQPEGSLDFANNMWGTFLNVDYRKSSPKMVCFYVGKPSQYLDLPKGNFRFRDDGFEMRRASENPLLENQEGKKDWAISNKCVGFNVDIGTRNQNIFYSFQVEQSGGVATSESINTQLNMVNQASGRNVATQNVSLYNLYKQRSYKCSVVCLGNALIQPSMYFNLRHVPMFNGPYLIQNINHTIQPGNFQTSFTGIRQGIYDLPSIDSFLQSMNQNLLTKLEEALKIKKDEPKSINTTEQQKSVDTVQKSDNKLDAQNSCTAKVDVITYQGYEVQAGNQTTLKPQEFANKLLQLVPGSQNQDLRAYIYMISYVNSYVQSSNSGVGEFVGYNNNYSLLSLDKNLSPTFQSYFNKKYACVSVKTIGSNNSLPIASFDSADKYILFMRDRLSENVDRIKKLLLAKYYVCYWPTTNVSESYFDQYASTEFKEVFDTMEKAYLSAVSVNLIPKEDAEESKKKSQQNSNTPQTPSVTPNPGQTCPPPVVSNFAPAIGNTGTIVQIKGQNLDTTTKVFINNTQVELKNVKIIDPQTIQVVVPKVGTSTVTGNIKVETFYGSYTTLATFKYDPKISASAASSPGSFVNGASNTEAAATGTNSNPQSTNAPTMIGTETKNGNSKVTNTLIVNMNPNAASGTIQKNVRMSISVFKNFVENNIPKQTLTQTSTMILNSFVSNNQFSITNEQVKTLLKTTTISDTDTVLIQFTLLAKAIDTNKYPSETEQSFNFTFQ